MLYGAIFPDLSETMCRATVGRSIDNFAE